MANTRLTAVIRKDLQMPTGLVAAQASHLGDEWMRRRILEGKKFTAEEKAWMVSPYFSVLAVQTIEELIMIQNDALGEDLTVLEWSDVIPCPTLDGRTMKAFIGISIGPHDFDAIKLVTNGLKLY